MNLTDKRIPLSQILPESQVGTARIEHFEVSYGGFGGFRAMRDGISEGKYCRLMIGQQLWMSDTHMEYSTNWRVRYRSFGDILIAGLGLGLVLQDILPRNDVRSVTVVERSQDVIDLIKPHYVSEKLTIVIGDIYKWRPEKGTKFDCIYFDVWAAQSTDCLEDMAKLHRSFARFRRRGIGEGWMDSWRRDELRAQKRRDARRGW